MLGTDISGILIQRRDSVFIMFYNIKMIFWIIKISMYSLFH